MQPAKFSTLCAALLFVSAFPKCGNAPESAREEDSTGSDTRTEAQFAEDPAEDASVYDHETKPPSAPADVLPAMWQVIAGSSEGVVVRAGSAFAIDDSLLATNAHVVVPLAEALRTGGIAWAVQHETGLSSVIVGAWIHPYYSADSLASPDVGIVLVGIRVPRALRLADTSVLQDLTVLDDIWLCGFPGDVASLVDNIWDLQIGGVFRPRATCLTGTISALRPINPTEPATPANALLVQHDIPTTEGTSGSPVLNACGEVVAINWGGSWDPWASTRFAVRSDALRELLDMIYFHGLPSINLTPIPSPPP